MGWATCVAGIRVITAPVHPVRGDGYIVRIHRRGALRHACAIATAAVLKSSCWGNLSAQQKLRAGWSIGWIVRSRIRFVPCLDGICRCGGCRKCLSGFQNVVMLSSCSIVIRHRPLVVVLCLYPDPRICGEQESTQTPADRERIQDGTVAAFLRC